MTAKRLTQERLMEVVTYTAETGEFVRRNSVSNVSAGPVCPRPSKNGYLRMRIDGKLYYLHRLAWLYVHGAWPSSLADHKDGDKTNNRIDNIRDATHAQNLQNVAAKGRGVSGLRGAYFDKASGKWQAKIMRNYRSISLGYYDTPELAHAAYLAGKREHHEFQPEFSR
jgi:hypothetical protein